MVLQVTCGTVTVCVIVLLLCVCVNVMTVVGTSAGFVGAGADAEPVTPVTGVDGAGVGCGTRVMLEGTPVQIPGF